MRETRQMAGVSAARFERWRGRAAGLTDDLDVLRPAALELRVELAALPFRTQLAALVAVADGSQALARLVQADLDAVAVLRAAGAEIPADRLLAMFPPDADAEGVTATRADDGWRLHGHRRVSTHPQAVDLVLVAADTGAGAGWFVVDTAAEGLTTGPVELNVVTPVDPNGPVSFTGVVAHPVDAPVWSAGDPDGQTALLRDAAVWCGAVRHLRTQLCDGAARTGDDAALIRLARADAWSAAADHALARAALAVDAARVATTAEPSSDGAGPSADGAGPSSDGAGRPVDGGSAPGRWPTSDVGPGDDSEVAVRRALTVAANAAEAAVRLVAVEPHRRTSDDTPLPNRMVQLQITLRRFDGEANLRALGRLLVAR